MLVDGLVEEEESGELLIDGLAVAAVESGVLEAGLADEVGSAAALLELDDDGSCCDEVVLEGACANTGLAVPANAIALSAAISLMR